MVDVGKDGSGARRVAAAAQRGIVAGRTPTWFRTLGLGAWLALGLVGFVGVVLLLIALVAEVAIPLAIAAVLAAVLVPLTDRLEAWRVPRWLGATFVLMLGLTAVAVTLAVVIGGLSSQSDEIWAQIEGSLQQADTAVTGASEDAGQQASTVAHSVTGLLLHGALGSLFESAGALVIGVVLAIFMLLFLLKDWSQITGWTASHLLLPPDVGRVILDDTVSAFRGYAAGLTIIGAANAVVVFIGAWALGVPLAGTIALVSFVTSYIPYIGAFVAGAFATIIAYGSGGLGDALAMLAIVLLANNTIQNVVEPFAFGARLRLHPLAVLLTVTTATMLFGVMGAVLAAPLTSAGVNAYTTLRRTGVVGGDPGSTTTTDEHPPEAATTPDAGPAPQQDAPRPGTAGLATP